MAIPTLILGLGGTGVLTLRALKAKVKLKQSGSLVKHELLAFDYDRLSLRDDLSRDASDFAGLEEGDEFYYLSPKKIEETVANLERRQDGEPVWDRLLEWFPSPHKVRIPTGDLEANGASQMRVLGRLGLFMNDEIVESQIRRKLSSLGSTVDDKFLERYQRVIIVSSLAGGTGSGMAIDCAYLARRQDTRPKVLGYFLLPEVFEDVDSGGRTYSNAYACLKELAYLKDQQIGFRANYYKIPPLDAPILGRDPFARVFLCQGQARNGDRGILSSCSTIADLIVAQLDRFIQSQTVSTSSNTLAAERRETQRRRRTHTFSTASSVVIPCAPLCNVQDQVLRRIIRALRDEADLDRLLSPKLKQLLLRGLQERSAQLRVANEEADWDEAAGENDEIDRKLIGIARRWARRMQKYAEVAANKVVGDLAYTLEVVSRHASERPDLQEVSASDGQGVSLGDDRSSVQAARTVSGMTAAEKLQKVRNIVTAVYSDDEYDQNLPALKEVPSFLEEDEQLKAETQTFLDLARQPDDSDSAPSTLHTRILLARLQKVLPILSFEFPDAEPEKVRKVREDLKAQEAIRSRLPQILGLQLVALDEGTLRTVLCKKMIDAMGTLGLKDKIKHILLARSARTLRDQIRAEATRVEKKIADYQDIWQTATPATMQDDSALQQKVSAFLQTHLPSLIEEAKLRINPEDRVDKKKQTLVGLLEHRLKQERLQTYTCILHEDQETAEKTIREALVNSRQNVFERRSPSPQQKGSALVLFPEGLYWDGGAVEGLKGFVEKHAKQILNVSNCIGTEHRGNDIWIYHENLFNPPEHIRNLDEYYRQYSLQEFKEVFHLDKRMLDDDTFHKEINADFSQEVVSCGNQGCWENIAPVPRGETVCPGCGNPIRSRCGNAICQFDGLDKEPEPRKHAKTCPRCGLFNHAAWWCCTKHTLPEEVSIEKERCPHCIEEYQADPNHWPEEKISLRPDFPKLQCPSCRDKARCDPGYQPFCVPPLLRKFYYNGVNGHDSEEFHRLAKSFSLPDSFRCPKCRAFLIPMHHRGQRSQCEQRDC